MRQLRLRFTMRRMMLVVAVLAVILGGFLAYFRDFRWIGVRRNLEARQEAIDHASRRHADWEALVTRTRSNRDPGIYWQRSEYQRILYGLSLELRADLNQAFARGFVYQSGDPRYSNAKVLAEMDAKVQSHLEQWNDSKNQALMMMDAEMSQSDLGRLSTQ